MATAAAAPLEELPVVQVFTTGDGVVVKWGEGGAKQTTGLHSTLYSNAPYSFSAVDSNGDEPFIKTFGSLLNCSGGILTIGQTRYRIQVQQKQQQQQKQQDDEGLKRAGETLEALVIKHRIIEDSGRPKRTLSYVSKSHALSVAITKNRITFGHEFFFSLESPIETTAFAANGPASTADENTTHHPYFMRETKKLIDSAQLVKFPICQQLFWTKIGHWLKLDDGISAGVEPDFCTTDHVSGEPLVASADAVKLPASKYDVTIAMEQKKSFADSDQIEIVDYGERILCIQRGRQMAFTALFHCSHDDKTIRWAKTTEVDGEFITKITKPASLKPKQDGQCQLLTMLSKTSSELGRDFPKFDQTECSEKLTVLYQVGEGATSTVYSAKLGEGEGVAKVMKNGFEHLAGHEKQILDRLELAGVPGLLASTKISHGVLFFNRLLRPFTGTFTVNQVADILDCLEQSHASGVVHRDIRPENIMQDGQGKAYLLDWGFAVIHNLDATPPEFEGTFRYASEAVLNAAIAGRPHRPLPKDDLESFVKTVAAVNSGGHRLWRKLSAIEQGNFLGARDTWENEKRQTFNESFLSMFTAAAAADYNTLKKLVY